MCKNPFNPLKKKQKDEKKTCYTNATNVKTRTSDVDLYKNDKKINNEMMKFRGKSERGGGRGTESLEVQADSKWWFEKYAENLTSIGEKGDVFTQIEIR